MRAIWFGLFAGVAGIVMAVGCAAQSSWISAEVSDRPIAFYMSPQTVERAYASMCSSTGSRPCDSASKYNVEVIIQQNSVGVVFVHQDREGRLSNELSVIPRFTCQYQGADPFCTDGRETPEQ